jgi:hypothetical protein
VNDPLGYSRYLSARWPFKDATQKVLASNSESIKLDDMMQSTADKSDKARFADRSGTIETERR